MSGRPARVTQAELNRALRAAAAAPCPTAVEVLPDGTIRLTPALAAEQKKTEPKAPKLEIRL
ncbi:hypothetical protein AMST5_01928 [freshwater sediment metagenome]|uniref:Uncharacterized protein n=1 Tax=freshwater sediment metagenome TaxID=556182 RepID=A0AA48RD72_9ZZZZ